ncbi:MAG: tRNA (adenosine(37)-N6)-threonylcarbamoyltransferase complex dimerization subunit type 1 TsaB [Proteobacteria bacterium]|nr:tRNA (adenosine(37)-N6)-threonylcarbamoyltransferase complex dimerization subunit type 1 TsaB [Pseudomonadota bacterium]MBU4009344.1 tRNA (adenosine(37)-N6)-threonylcarbamoyltransferase complex dimerization subunit type 1 TsaB [Pseudomonadota bacterium]
MKILAVDTAARYCSVAIVQNNNLLAELFNESQETHSKHLMSMIKEGFKISGFNTHDMDGFSVTTGPGSFTGLRIGISCIKGLAEATGRSVAAISTLDALAAQLPETPYLICIMTDARKGEVYSSRYRFINGVLKKEIKEKNFIPVMAIKDINEPCLFIGDGVKVCRNVIEDKLDGLANFMTEEFNVIKASTVAFLGIKKFLNNDVEDAELIVPYYIRKSDINKKKLISD